MNIMEIFIKLLYFFYQCTDGKYIKLVQTTPNELLLKTDLVPLLKQKHFQSGPAVFALGALLYC